MADCPHCKHDLGPEYVSPDEHRKRLKAKDTTIGELQSTVDTLRTKAEQFDSVNTQLTNATRELERAKSSLTRTRSLAEKGITNPKAMRGFERAYDDYASEAGQGAKSFADWLAADAKEDPLLAPLLTAAPAAPAGDQRPEQKPGEQPAGNGTPPAAGAGASAQGQGQGAKGPPIDPGTKPPPSQGRMTPGQLSEYLRSPAYRSLPVAEQRKKLAELQQQTTAQPSDARTG